MLERGSLPPASRGMSDRSMASVRRKMSSNDRSYGGDGRKQSVSHPVLYKMQVKMQVVGVDTH